MTDKERDLAGPGIGSYEELARILPADYRSLLTPRETQQAIFAAKGYIEEQLCQELNLMMVTVPLIVDVESGVNDMLDRDGSRTPVQFHIANDHGKHPVDAQVVQAATKWKRLALKQFSMGAGEGICTDMRAVRKDYFLDHDHSAYVDQWDWEQVITPEQRNLDYLTTVVKRIWRVIKGAEAFLLERFPQLLSGRYPALPEKLVFLHAEEILPFHPNVHVGKAIDGEECCLSHGQGAGQGDAFGMGDDGITAAVDQDQPGMQAGEVMGCRIDAVEFAADTRQVPYSAPRQIGLSLFL